MYFFVVAVADGDSALSFRSHAERLTLRGVEGVHQPKEVW